MRVDARADAATITVSVFARTPVAGVAKTRLIPRLGALGAANWHDRAVAHALATVRSLTAQPRVRDDDAGQRPHDRVRRVLWFDGEPSDAALLRWQRDDADLELRRQVAGDLGVRMFAALEHGLASSAAVVLIGTDCPLLDAAHLEAAIRALLDGADLVLGPVDDGGYVLVGLRGPSHPSYRSLFRGMPWGSAAVTARTLSVAAERGLDVVQLPALFDIDEPADLDRLHRVAPQFIAWLSAGEG